MYPLLIDLWFWKIGSYGFTALVSIAFTLFLLRYYSMIEMLPYNTLFKLYFIIIVFSLLGAKLLHLIISFRQIAEKPALAWNIAVSGGVFYGGYLAGFAAAIAYMKYAKLSILKMIDVYSLLLMVGLGISRVGCFLSGCCYGKSTDVPWAVTFTNPLAHRLHPDLPYIPIHPTQLYEAFACFIIFVILNIIYLHKRFDGQVGISCFILYGLARSFIEIYRGDFRGSIFGLSTSQFIGLSTALIAVLAYIYFWKKNKRRMS